MWMSTALAMEAQALFTAGTRFRSRFLRGLVGPRIPGLAAQRR